MYDIHVPLIAWLSCTTLRDSSTTMMIVMATTNRALASLAWGSVIVDVPHDACLAKLI